MAVMSELCWDESNTLQVLGDAVNQDMQDPRLGDGRSSWCSDSYFNGAIGLPDFL